MQSRLQHLVFGLFFASQIGLDVLVELSNLVRIHTRSRNFDCAAVVEVEVTQCKCQLFQMLFCQRRIVQGNVEVDWQSTSFSGFSSKQVEVEVVSCVFH